MGFPSSEDIKRAMLSTTMTEEEIQAFDRKFEAEERRHVEEQAQRAGFNSSEEMNNAIRMGHYTPPMTNLSRLMSQSVQSRFTAAATGEMEDRRSTEQQQSQQRSQNQSKVSDRFQNVAEDVGRNAGLGGMSR